MDQGSDKESTKDKRLTENRAATGSGGGRRAGDGPAEVIEDTGVAIVPMRVWKSKGYILQNLSIFVIGLGLCTLAFFNMTDNNSKYKYWQDRNEAQDAAIDQFKKDTKTLTTTIETLQKELVGSKKEKAYLKRVVDDLKAEMQIQNGKTRDTVNAAWKNHDNRLKAMATSIEALEKQLKNKKE